MSDLVRWVVPAILVVSVVGALLVLWRERRPSYRQRWEGEMAAWRAMSARAQEAHDNAVLDAAEAAETAAARTHSLYRP